MRKRDLVYIVNPRDDNVVAIFEIHVDMALHSFDASQAWSLSSGKLSLVSEGRKLRISNYSEEGKRFYVSPSREEVFDAMKREGMVLTWF